MPDDRSIETDVIIIGGGPVGVSLAILLAQHDIRSVVVESHDEIYALPRAVHLDDEVYRILSQLGVGEEFASISLSAPGLRLVDRNYRTIAQFDRAVHSASGLPEASLFDQPELEVLLRKRLTAFESVTPLFGWTAGSFEQSTTGTTLSARSIDGSHATISGAFLVGCDGANSWTRAQLGISGTDLGFEQRWLVIDGRSEDVLDEWGGVYQICDPARPGTFMRVGRDRYRWEFRLDHEDRRANWDDTRIRQLLEPWTSRAPGAQLHLVRVAEYTFKAETATHWRSGRAFLAGDAAHLTPPFIGQGLGSGLRDAANLAWKLTAVIAGAAPESLLDSYEGERKPHAVGLIRKAKMIGTIMTGRSIPARMVRNTLMPLASRVKPLEQQIVSSATPALREQRQGSLSRGRLAGSLIPRAIVPGDAGTMVIDEALGGRFALLSLDGAAPVGAEELGIVRISSAGGAGERSLASWLKKARADWAIVRPDRAVFASGPKGARLDHADSALLRGLAADGQGSAA